MIFWSLFAIGLGTEYGEWVTTDSEKIYTSLCQSDWYLLPFELQRMLVVAMLGGQQPDFSWLWKHRMRTRNIQEGKI